MRYPIGLIPLGEVIDTRLRVDYDIVKPVLRLILERDVLLCDVPARRGSCHLVRSHIDAVAGLTFSARLGCSKEIEW